MREIVHLQAGQCGNQIGAKVSSRNECHTLLLRFCVNAEGKVVVGNVWFGYLATSALDRDM